MLCPIRIAKPNVFQQLDVHSALPNIYPIEKLDGRTFLPVSMANSQQEKTLHQQDPDIEQGTVRPQLPGIVETLVTVSQVMLHAGMLPMWKRRII
jgi:hypothetical protein